MNSVPIIFCDLLIYFPIDLFDVISPLPPPEVLPDKKLFPSSSDPAGSFFAVVFRLLLSLSFFVVVVLI